MTRNLTRQPPREFPAKKFCGHSGCAGRQYLGDHARRLIRFVPRGPATMPVEVPLPAMDEAEIEYLTFSRKGVLWVDRPRTLYRYDGKNGESLKVKDGLNGQTMTSLARPTTTRSGWRTMTLWCDARNAGPASGSLRFAIGIGRWWAARGEPNLVRRDGWNRHSLAGRSSCSG